MFAMDLVEQGGGVSAPVAGKYPNEKPGIVHNLLYPGVLGHAHQHGVETQVMADETIHLVGVQGFGARTDQFVLQRQKIVDQNLEVIGLFLAQPRPDDLAHFVNFQGLAEFVKFEDVLTLQLNYQRSTGWTLLKQSLGYQLANCFPNWRATTAQFTGEFDL